MVAAEHVGVRTCFLSKSLATKTILTELLYTDGRGLSGLAETRSASDVSVWSRAPWRIAFGGPGIHIGAVDSNS